VHSFAHAPSAVKKSVSLKLARKMKVDLPYEPEAYSLYLFRSDCLNYFSLKTKTTLQLAFLSLVRILENFEAPLEIN
jgi:hypothetical protein